MTASVTHLPAAEVEAAREQLRADLDALTAPQSCLVEFDDGERRTFTAPARLVQLEQDMHAVGARAASGAFTPGSKPPLGIDALTLLEQVDRETGREDGADRAARVWTWGQARASDAPGPLVDAAGDVATWRRTVENILDPPPRHRLRGQACPSCRAQKVWDRHDEGAGESHARPALEVDSETGVCRCLCCSESWPPELFEHLRAVLEQQQHETLAVEAWDPRVRARTAGEAGLRWYDVGEEDLPAVPVSPRGDVGVVPSQCTERVAMVDRGEPVPGRTRRCPALLGSDGQCYLAERHV